MAAKGGTSHKEKWQEKREIDRIEEEKKEGKDERRAPRGRPRDGAKNRPLDTAPASLCVKHRLRSAAMLASG